MGVGRRAGEAISIGHAYTKAFELATTLLGGVSPRQTAMLITMKKDYARSKAKV